MGFAVRNVGIALAIAVTILNKAEFAVFATVYFITEVPLMLGTVLFQRNRSKAAPGPKIDSATANSIVPDRGQVWTKVQ